MKTRILLAIAGALALSACGRNKKTVNPDGWEFPLIESARPVATDPNAPAPVAPVPAPPTGPRTPGTDIFRQPDPTTNLPNLRSGSPTGRVVPSPVPNIDGALSINPPLQPTPPVEPSPSPVPTASPAPTTPSAPAPAPAPDPKSSVPVGSNE